MADGAQARQYGWKPRLDSLFPPRTLTEEEWGREWMELGDEQIERGFFFAKLPRLRSTKCLNSRCQSP